MLLKHVSLARRCNVITIQIATSNFMRFIAWLYATKTRTSKNVWMMKAKTRTEMKKE